MKKVAVVIFLAVLVAPSIIWFGFLNDEHKENLENREMASFPEISQTGWDAFFSSVDSWFMDNAPFKNEAVSLKNTIDIALFNHVDSSNVIYGKNGWLFYKSVSDGNPLAEYKGQLSLSNEVMEEYANLYRKAESNLALQDISLYQIVAPNKEITMSEYMPDEIKVVAETTRTKQLENYLHALGITSFDYLSDDITKDGGYPFYKLDTHWNWYGAQQGYSRFLTMIGSENTTSSNAELVLTERNKGDLSTMLSMEMDEPFSYEAAQEFKYNEEILISGYLKIFESTIDNPDSRNVLLIGDSFREGLEYFFAQDFNSTVAVHRDKLNSDEYESLDFKPNIVVIISPERNILENIPVLEMLSEAKF